MKTLIDLREKQTSEVIQAVQNFYNETIQIVSFGNQSIHACIGCWSCWLKTPGKCIMRDQMAESYASYINSDTVIILMDTAQGFINHQAKAFFDRSIPHYLPYIEIADGECQHVSRYEVYPDMVFFYNTEGLTPAEEKVIEDYLYRTSYQFKSKAYRMVIKEKVQLSSLESRDAKIRTVKFAATKPMNLLIIYNGSPRKSGSNSAIFLEKAAEVFADKVEIRDLKERNKWDEWAGSFKHENNVMFFLPLYVHSMPSHVMGFIEKLQASEGSISFFVQSGYPESRQSHYLEAYYEQLALRLGRIYIGTAIKGGLDGLQRRTAAQQEKILEPMIKIIRDLIYEGYYNPAFIRQLANPVRLGFASEILLKLLSRFGIINASWDQNLKDNNAYEKRFDRPYICATKKDDIDSKLTC
jgi:multimeric flavodoxin WrbA